MEKKRKEYINLLIVVLPTLCITVVILSLMIGSTLLSYAKYKEISKPFLSHVWEYVNIKDLKDNPNNYSPYIIGKIVIVDDIVSYKLRERIWKGRIPLKYIRGGPSRRINSVEFLKLPVQLRAISPEEVGTIIWLKWDSIRVGAYGKLRTYRGREMPRSGGYRITCEVIVIDKVKRSVVGRRVFRGGMPPKSKRRSSPGSQYGSEPTKQIVEYIMSLPLRPDQD